MNTKILTQLQDLNFSPNEAKVYIALLEIGQTSAGAIIKETRLHRSVVYETLDKLIYRKLVFKLEKNKISHFQATNPSRILEDVERQKEIAKSLIPQLKNFFDEKLPEITIYQGIESYRHFWIESIQKMPVGSTDYIAGSIGDKYFKYFGDDFAKYEKIKAQRKIKWKSILFNQDAVDMEHLKKYPKLNEFRFIDRKFERDGNFNVLGDESVLLHSAAEPMIIEIKNKTLVKVFRNLFDVLWEIGEEIKV
ncbi:MAG: helix-turn-helix domain-containing protein [bacterium]